MRVVVTGLVATYPVGGVAWDYLQYVQGFRTLGCEVTYLEDTGQWLYDPAAQTFTDDVRANARHLNDALASLEPALARRWPLRAPDGPYHGPAAPADRARQLARARRAGRPLHHRHVVEDRADAALARRAHLRRQGRRVRAFHGPAVPYPGDARGGARGRGAARAHGGRRLAAPR